MTKKAFSVRSLQPLEPLGKLLEKIWNMELYIDGSQNYKAKKILAKLTDFEGFLDWTTLRIVFRTSKLYLFFFQVQPSDLSRAQEVLKKKTSFADPHDNMLTSTTPPKFNCLPLKMVVERQALPIGFRWLFRGDVKLRKGIHPNTQVAQKKPAGCAFIFFKLVSKALMAAS